MKRVDLKKILYMDFLIRHKCTGTSKEFAAKMDMSRSTLSHNNKSLQDGSCRLFIS